jgi:hypothetical protein
MPSGSLVDKKGKNRPVDALDDLPVFLRDGYMPTFTVIRGMGGGDDRHKTASDLGKDSTSKASFSSSAAFTKDGGSDAGAKRVKNTRHEDESMNGETGAFSPFLSSASICRGGSRHRRSAKSNEENHEKSNTYKNTYRDRPEPRSTSSSDDGNNSSEDDGGRPEEIHETEAGKKSVSRASSDRSLGWQHAPTGLLFCSLSLFEWPIADFPTCSLCLIIASLHRFSVPRV